ncbi:MAG: hypothetical protein U5N21_01005 [Rhodococcus sp. (in: high G+C Gram-positive bacteria)]|nr:hypothetical protein [Rhodococcus sp. (in: high G+C Gram-positive bacteria)]
MLISATIARQANPTGVSKPDRSPIDAMTNSVTTRQLSDAEQIKQSVGLIPNPVPEEIPGMNSTKKHSLNSHKTVGKPTLRLA